MAGSMEAVTTNAVFLIVLMRNCVQISFLRHRHTKSSIPYSYVSFARHNSLTSLNSHQVSRVVQRSKIEALTDYFLNIFVYNDGLAVFGSCMQYTMSYSCDLVSTLNNTVLSILQRIQNQTDSNFMIRHSLLYNVFVFSRYLMSQFGAFNTDSLAETFCYYALIVHIDQLIFQGRASAVDN